MDYGVTDRGFVVKPFEVILREEQDDFRTAFGNDIDLSDTSIDGVYVKNQALKRAQLWEQLGKLYAIGDVDDSFGVHLDRLVNYVNVQRLPASATRVYECCWAEEGIAIPKGHLLRMGKTRTFKSTADITVNKSSLLGFYLAVAEVVEGHTYQFIIDTEIISYTAAEGDDIEKIKQGLINSLNAVYSQGTYTAENKGEDGLVIHRSDGTIPFALSSPDAILEFPLLGGYSRYECTATGTVIVSAGALNEIINKINGLDSVVNYAPGITGRAMESDTELRMDLGTRQKQATANEIAIQNEILKADGVKYARVYSNRSSSWMNGRPPKSYEAVVVGGDEQEIAETIFDKGPGGIQAFGNIVKDVTDSEGFHWDIGFSRPVNRYIWIKVDYSRNSEEDLPLDAVSAVQDNITAWGQAALNVGIDLIFQKMFRPVYDVRGIGFAAIKVAATLNLTPPAAEDYRAQNITISEVEIAELDKSRITVQELTG